MWPYVALLGLFAIASLFNRPDLDRVKPLGLLLKFAGCIMVLFIGLRDHVGTDWPNYHRQWIAAQYLPFGKFITTYGDPGFYSLMWLLAHLGFEFWMLNLVCAAIFTSGLFVFARQFPNPWLSVTIAVPYLVIVIAMSAERQATALGFVFLALVAFSRRKTLPFLGWSFAATLFHASAALTVPFAGLSFAKNKFQAVLIALTLLALGWFTLRSTFQDYSLRYSVTGLQSSGLFYRVAMSGLAGILYFIAIRPRVPVEEHQQALWRNYSLFALGAFVLAWFFPTSVPLDRTLIYVFPLQIYVLSLFPYVWGRETSPILVILAMLPYFAIILVVFLTFGVNAHNHIPYRMYWPGD